MEFLMTYGWAILVVLAAIAALAYFGVLSPEKILGEKCIIETGLACVGHKVEPSQVTLVLSQNTGKTLTIDSISVGDCSGTFSQTMLSGEDANFVMTGCSNGVHRLKTPISTRVAGASARHWTPPPRTTSLRPQMLVP